MRVVDAGAHVLEGLGDDSPLVAEHAGDVGCGHVKGVVGGLLPEHNPRPALGLLPEYLAEAEAHVLVLEADVAALSMSSVE